MYPKLYTYPLRMPKKSLALMIPGNNILSLTDLLIPSLISFRNYYIKLETISS